MQKPGGDNTIFNTAADFINNSNHPVFLTGKAGTGKTTFLKYIKENTRKNTAIVAPTGVAAINAGGTTIHSFFQLPFGPYIPENKNHFSLQSSTADKNSLLGNLRLTAERKELIQLLELLIIDEISMVRCDVLDAIDAVLRHVRRIHSKPFGGVQVLYIGDMYQLPPVIKDEEWRILSSVYDNQYFFSSQVIKEQYPIYIELQKVYRQSDSSFIGLLNQVRNNEMDEDGYNLLHSRYMPDYKPGNTDGFITLTTHNNKADAINVRALSELNEKTYSFNATVNGSFFENSFPADEVLNLKVGAQVMFLKNDTEKIRRYYNGKIGVIKKFDEDKIWVECKQEDSLQLIEVKKETWRNIRYTLNDKTQHIEEEELGSFTQYPLRLAWAITIHKSQGLTFQNAIIDAGSAFAPGQVYVALSRCTSLDGIILHSKISYSSLHSDERIVDFASKQQSNKLKEQILFNAAKQYQQDIILELFDFKNVEAVLRDLLSWVKENNVFGGVVIEWLSSLKAQVGLFNSHSEKFEAVLNSLFLQENLPEENDSFQQRFKKAAEWFYTEVDKIKKLILKSPAVTDNRNLAKDYNNRLQKAFDLLSYKTHLFSSCRNGFILSVYCEQKAAFKKELFLVNAYSGKSNYISNDILHPDLYNDLKDKRNQIAAEKGIAVYMVCKTQSLEEMTQYLPCSLEALGLINGFGSVKLKQYGNDFLNIIKDYCELNNIESSSPVIPVKKVRKAKSVATNNTIKPDTKKESFDLYKTGKSFSEIAKERNLALTTIEGHMAYFIEKGELNIDELLDKDKQEKIRSVLKNSETSSLQSLKELLPFASYAELKWMIASEKKKNDSEHGSTAEIVL
ncbi:MAG: helix-turn-helix domain-containing protein [Ferruginibacter sp.]